MTHHQHCRRAARRALTASLTLACGAGAALLAAAAPAAATTHSGTILAGTTLRVNDSVVSGTVLAGPNHALDHYYKLQYQSNGDLVEYDVYPYQQSAPVVWSTHTGQGGGTTASFTTTGALVTSSTQGVRWTSGTGGLGATKLSVQTDGNIVIRTAGGTAMWASKNALCAKTGSITSGQISSAISAGCREVRTNTWYSWGGGHGPQPGATYGHYDGSDPASLNDNTRKGFDCSGLTRWEFYRGTTHDMPSTSGTAQQQLATLRGTRISSKSNLRVGDLLYFGTSSNIHHTAIYVGSGYILEAPYSGAHVRVAPLSWHSDFYIAVRAFT